MTDAVAINTETQFGAVPLMAKLTREQCSHIWTAGRSAQYRKGDVIVSQGTAPATMHVLLTGRAVSLATTAAGRSVLLNSWQGPVIVDKVPTFARQPHPATVVADTTAVVHVVAASTAMEVVQQNPEATRHALENVALLAHDARESLLDIATKSSRARLATWLLNSAGSGRLANIPLPQERLAWTLGMTRVTLNRALNNFVNEGLINAEGAQIAILDRPAMTEIASDAKP